MAKSRVELSIIVPIFNAEKYLQNCLDSLRKQTFSQWEALLIDDGSTDGSKDIIDKFVSIDQRFRALHLSNHGVSYARNRGLELSKGSYVTFVDSDDIFDENMLLNQMRKMDCSGSDVVQCNYVDLFPNGNILKHGSDIEYSVAGVDSILRECFEGFLNSSVCTKVYRRSVISNIRFDETISVGEDMLFNIEVCSKANRVFICNDYSYYYVIHDESVMHRAVGEKRLDVLRVFDSLREKYSGDHRAFEHILVGEIKELITIINLLIGQKGKKETIDSLEKKLVFDYENLQSKKLLTRRNRLICSLINLLPWFYSFLVLKKMKKRENR